MTTLTAAPFAGTLGARRDVVRQLAEILDAAGLAS